MSKFMLTAFAALAVTLSSGAAFAGSDSYPDGVSRPIQAWQATEPTGSDSYPVALGSGSVATESRVVANDTGSEAMPLFAGKKAITDFGEPTRIVGEQNPTG